METMEKLMQEVHKHDNNLINSLIDDLILEKEISISIEKDREYIFGINRCLTILRSKLKEL